MAFALAYFIVAVSCIIITARTLVAYTDFSAWIKASVYILITMAWFAPMLLWSIQPRGILSDGVYNIVSRGGYFLYGFAFILVMLIVARDILWSVVYYVSGKAIFNPLDSCVLLYLNIITLVVALFLSIYAVYSAEKLPRVWHYEYSDARIKRPLKVLMVSDTHINKMKSVQKVEQLVQYLNGLQPDIILMAGDIADDKADDIKEQIAALGEISAPLGIYYVLGNHETYFDAVRWEAEFAGLGWQVLHNSGVEVAETGLYIAGVPDAGRFAINIAQSLRSAKESDYRILLSHVPTTIKRIGDKQIDVQFSGHTHGGQIFPFNFLAKWANAGYLAGEYSVGNTKLLLSRGVSYWGPPMRLFAPNDVMLLELKPALLTPNLNDILGNKT